MLNVFLLTLVQGAEDQRAKAVDEGPADYWRQGGRISPVHMAGVHL